MTGGDTTMYLGCYTPASGGGRGEGVAAVRREPADGTLTLVGTVAVTPSPSFLVRHPARAVLYAVNELSEGTVSAWRIEPDGGLTDLGVRSTGGDSPCHLAVSPDGRQLFAANYGSGSVSVHPLDAVGAPGERTDLVQHGGHGPDPERQEGPHAHMVSPDPAGGPLFAVDLGTDSVHRYDPDPVAGRLRPHGTRLRTRAGAGPRHLARHPDGRHCYLVGELDGTVQVYRRDDRDDWREAGRVPASGRTGHVQPSEVALDAGGRYLYVANRGVGTLTAFALDEGLPRAVAEVDAGGDWPRHFAILGRDIYVAQERTDEITHFIVDAATGVPAPAGAPLRVSSPTCVLPPP